MSTCAAWVKIWLIDCVSSLPKPTQKIILEMFVGKSRFRDLGHTSSFHFSQWFWGLFGRVSSLHSYHQFPFKPSPDRSVKPSSGNSSSCCDAGQGANPCYYDGSNVWTHRWKRWGKIRWKKRKQMAMAIATPKFGGFFVRGYMINQDIMGVGDRHFTFQVEKFDMILSMQCRFGIELDDLGSSWMCMIFVAMFTPITCDEPVFWRNPTEIIVNSDAWIIPFLADIWYTPGKKTFNMEPTWKGKSSSNTSMF